MTKSKSRLSWFKTWAKEDHRVSWLFNQDNGYEAHAVYHKLKLKFCDSPDSMSVEDAVSYLYFELPRMDENRIRQALELLIKAKMILIENGRIKNLLAEEHAAYVAKKQLNADRVKKHRELKNSDKNPPPAPAEPATPPAAPSSAVNGAPSPAVNGAPSPTVNGAPSSQRDLAIGLFDSVLGQMEMEISEQEGSKLMATMFYGSSWKRLNTREAMRFYLEEKLRAMRKPKNKPSAKLTAYERNYAASSKKLLENGIPQEMHKYRIDSEGLIR
jgi:hypothetical protein